MELQSKIEKERKKLSEIRKRHYQLAGESEGWEVGRVIVIITLSPRWARTEPRWARAEPALLMKLNTLYLFASC